MTSTNTKQPKIYTRDQAKARARVIRADEKLVGRSLSHCAALEKVAKEQGYPSWNVMSARLSNEPVATLNIGTRVSGNYLKQPFEGTVVSVHSLSEGRAYELSIELDEAVDVVEFDSFSNLRRRISGKISPGGVSFAKTSDGTPHLVVSSAQESFV